jgi:hypothetical protein
MRGSDRGGWLTGTDRALCSHHARGMISLRTRLQPDSNALPWSSVLKKSSPIYETSDRGKPWQSPPWQPGSVSRHNIAQKPENQDIVAEPKNPSTNSAIAWHRIAIKCRPRAKGKGGTMPPSFSARSYRLLTPGLGRSEPPVPLEPMPLPMRPVSAIASNALIIHVLPHLPFRAAL